MNNFHLTKDWITYRLISKNQYGIHSPFVFKFYNEIVKNRNSKVHYSKIEAQREKLLSSREMITIKDFGAGSRIFNSNQREVRKMAKHVLQPPKYAQLLYRIIKYFEPRNVFELGTSFGITTSYLASANSDSTIHTLEGCPETLKIAQSIFSKLSLQNIKTHLGNFSDILHKKIEEVKTVDFAFIDGNHSKNPTIDYYHFFREKSHPNTILVFDDIYWNNEMKEAWQEIKEKPEVTVTIDLFKIGIVFFREGQAKEHFKLRY